MWGGQEPHFILMVLNQVNKKFLYILFKGKFLQFI